MGDVEDGHAPRQLQHVSLEGLGVAPPGFGKGDLDLTHQATRSTFDPRDGQDHGSLPAADGQGNELSLRVTAGGDVAGTAGRAATVVGILGDGEDHLAALVVGADIVVAADAECVIQQAGGHADLPVWSVFDTTPSGVSMSTFFKTSARFRRMNQLWFTRCARTRSFPPHVKPHGDRSAQKPGQEREERVAHSPELVKGRYRVSSSQLLIDLCYRPLRGYQTRIALPPSTHLRKYRRNSRRRLRKSASSASSRVGDAKAIMRS